MVVPLPYPGVPGAVSGGLPWGAGSVCAAEELQCPCARRHTQLAAAAPPPPPPGRDCEQQLWALAPGERAGMAGEGHGAPRSTRMLLGAGMHCWRVTGKTMVAAELLRCAVRATGEQDLQGTGHSAGDGSCVLVVMAPGLSSAATLLGVLSLVTVLPRLKCLCPLHGDFGWVCVFFFSFFFFNTLRLEN